MSRPARALRGRLAALLVACGLVAGNAHAAAAPAGERLRIVALAPSLTELVFAAGAGDLLVGVSAFSDFPEAAKTIPQVADAAGIHWEGLLASRPGLVLAWESGTRPQDVQRLKDLGIPTLTITVRALDDVPRAIEAIGRVAGRQPAAAAESARIRRSIASAAPVADRAQVPVFIEISTLPLMTVNGGHVLSEIVSRCGGRNVFADAAALVVEPSRESLLARKPRVLLRPRGKDAIGDAPYYPQTNDSPPEVRTFTPDWAFRPGPRLVDALHEICKALASARPVGEAR